MDTAPLCSYCPYSSDYGYEWGVSLGPGTCLSAALPWVDELSIKPFSGFLVLAAYTHILSQKRGDVTVE